MHVAYLMSKLWDPCAHALPYDHLDPGSSVLKKSWSEVLLEHSCGDGMRAMTPKLGEWAGLYLMCIHPSELKVPTFHGSRGARSCSPHPYTVRKLGYLLVYTTSLPTGLLTKHIDLPGSEFPVAERR